MPLLINHLGCTGMTSWDTEPDPFFTLLDADEIADTPPLPRSRRTFLPPGWPAQADLSALLAPLTTTQDALARLDARAARRSRHYP